MSTTSIIETLKTKHKDGTQQAIYPKTVLQAVVDPETNQNLDEIVQDLRENAGSVEIVNTLDSTSTDAALSANQGRVLNEKVDDIKTKAVVAEYDEATATLSLQIGEPVQGIVVDTLESDSVKNALSANQGRVLNEKVVELEEAVEVIGTGGSDVEVTPELTSGVKIGSITVDGTSTDLYAPDSVTYDNATTSTDGLMSAQDKTKLDGIDLDTKVDKTTTVNGKALSSKIVLGANDVGADATGSAAQALTDAKSYTDTKIDAIVGEGASTTLDTIGEIAQAIEDHKEVTDALNAAIGNKVDKVSGKGLSTNDYTTDEKNKLAGIAAGAQVNSITGVKGNDESTYRTGNVNITPANIGLGNVNNTTDIDKPISKATQTALDAKANKVDLNGLITVDTYTGHAMNRNNPHKVTKEQVGLGNVDNTSDADKPISTATQTALDEINSNLKWKYWTNAFGTTSIALPEKYEELILEVERGESNVRYPIHVTYAQLVWTINNPGTELCFKAGQCTTSTNFESVSVIATTTYARIYGVYDGGQNITDTSELRVYYR